MKKIGLLLIVIALSIGLVLPWAKLNFDENVVSEVSFPEFHKTGKAEQTVLLTKADNPLRIRFVARYKVGGLLPPVKIPLQVKLSDRDGTLIGAIISFPTNGIDTGTEQPKTRSGTHLLATVQHDGLHKLEIEFAPNKNNNGIEKPDVDVITASFVANAAPVENQYQIPALILGLLGFYLLIRSRRSGKSKAKSQPHKWGR
jgi:hypothetical protein